MLLVLIQVFGNIINHFLNLIKGQELLPRY